MSGFYYLNLNFYFFFFFFFFFFLNQYLPWQSQKKINVVNAEPRIQHFTFDKLIIASKYKRGGGGLLARY
jgi:hypothetical protein